MIQKASLSRPVPEKSITNAGIGAWGRSAVVGGRSAHRRSFKSTTFPGLAALGPDGPGRIDRRRDQERRARGLEDFDHGGQPGPVQPARFKGSPERCRRRRESGPEGLGRSGRSGQRPGQGRRRKQIRSCAHGPHGLRHQQEHAAAMGLPGRSVRCQGRVRIIGAGQKEARESGKREMASRKDAASG